MEYPGQVLSRDKLESRLYGWGEELSSNSIEVHVHNLRKKAGSHRIHQNHSWHRLYDTGSVKSL